MAKQSRLAPATLIDETARPSVIHISVRKDGRTDRITAINQKNRINLCGAPISAWDTSVKNIGWLGTPDNLCPACSSMLTKEGK